jgi:hypothetical protein
VEITLVESEGVEMRHGDCFMIRLFFVGNMISMIQVIKRKGHTGCVSSIQAD